MSELARFDYHLPEELIAQVPLEDRAASRLLWIRPEQQAWSHHAFRDIREILRAGDLLVLNDTRVSAARIFGQKPTGGEVEALLLREGKQPFEFIALMRPGKRLPAGARVVFEGGLHATVTETLAEGQKRVLFDEVQDLADRLREIGQAPLPPYIRTRLDNPGRYQTVYARAIGSSAAPTAGLHFTRDILAELGTMGIATASVTLDVGLDTFRPVQVDDLDQHPMHGERCQVSAETAEAIAKCQGRVIAVGTTSVRTLETFARGPKTVEPGESVSKLFIRPGYEFRIVDGMFTNFHMPKTTMLMMISALAGVDLIMDAYRDAVAEKYRFLSFGDSMLIL